MTELETLFCRIAEQWEQEGSGLIMWNASSDAERRLIERLRRQRLISYRQKDMLDGSNIYEEVKLSTSGLSLWYSIKSRA